MVRTPFFSGNEVTSRKSGYLYIEVYNTAVK
jgi:hypothetical protein